MRGAIIVKSWFVAGTREIRLCRPIFDLDSKRFEDMPDSLSSAYGMTLDDWTEWMEANRQSKFRAKQIVGWLFQKRVVSFDEMTNLSHELREQLKREFVIGLLPAVRLTGSQDTTRKFLYRLSDDRLIETVKIPANANFDGERSGRITLCVSSQVGCAYDCKFCASGLAGFTRNLTAGEIVGQIMTAEHETGDSIRNIVFMGMGEPLANLTQLTKALTILNAEWGMNLGARHMTVSTSGLAPQIEKLAKIPMQIRLAISLHGATDDVREQIMPVNKKYPIQRLFQALEMWMRQKKQMITFEYILIEGVNDSLEQAKILASRAKSLHAKVNLIPYNTVEGLPWKRPDIQTQDAFLNVLSKANISATIRREKGHDIDAACGQLRLQEEGDNLPVRSTDRVS